MNQSSVAEAMQVSCYVQRVMEDKHGHYCMEDSVTQDIHSCTPAQNRTADLL